MTLAEAALPLVVPAKVDRIDLLEDALLALPGVIVRELRLTPLPEGGDTVCLCDATKRLLVGVLAASTVRLTGRERVALLRVGRLETEREDLDLEGVGVVDRLGLELEDREDALGAVDAAGVFAGFDRLF